MAFATTCQGYVYLTDQNKFVYSNGNNTSVAIGSENCYQVKNNLQNILAANQMNIMAEKNMQKFIDQQKQIGKDLQNQYFPAFNLNASETAKINKKLLAEQEWVQAYQQRVDYLKQVHDNTKQLQEMMKHLKQQRLNIS